MLNFKRPESDPIPNNELCLLFLSFSINDENDNYIDVNLHYQYKTSLFQLNHKNKFIAHINEISEYFPSISKIEDIGYFTLSTDVNNEDNVSNTIVKFRYEQCKNAIIKQNQELEKFLNLKDEYAYQIYSLTQKSKLFLIANVNNKIKLKNKSEIKEINVLNKEICNYIKDEMKDEPSLKDGLIKDTPEFIYKKFNVEIINVMKFRHMVAFLVIRKSDKDVKYLVYIVLKTDNKNIETRYLKQISEEFEKNLKIEKYEQLSKEYEFKDNYLF
jgi:hypothetical protein